MQKNKGPSNSNVATSSAQTFFPATLWHLGCGNGRGGAASLSPRSTPQAVPEPVPGNHRCERAGARCTGQGEKAPFFLQCGPALLSLPISGWGERRKKRRDFWRGVIIGCLPYIWICGKHILSFISMTRTVGSSFGDSYGLFPCKLGPPRLKV